MKRKIIPYNPKLKLLARKLRNNSTKSEITLWNQLKGKQFHGYAFHRQKPLLNFIVDFFCYDLLLVIELDGYTHQFEQTYEKDIKKQQELENMGLSVLRYTDNEVLTNLLGVVDEIERYIEQFEHTPQSLSRGRLKVSNF